MGERTGSFSMETAETQVSVSIKLDGTGECHMETGNGMLDHLLAQLARHGLFDITVTARGDIQTGWHHTAEDVAIALGRALREAVGEGRGLRRMGHALVPLDEALAQVAVDLGGRGYASVDVGLTNASVGELPGDLVRHFLEAFAVEAGLTLHARVLSGVNPHHKAESIFKALARALRDACDLDVRLGDQIPSTKGKLRA